MCLTVRKIVEIAILHVSKFHTPLHFGHTEYRGSQKEQITSCASVYPDAMGSVVYSYRSRCHSI